MTGKLKASSPTSAIMTSGSHSCWRLAAYRRPSRTPPVARRPRAPGRSERSITSAAITARYDSALTAKHGVVPIVRISTPARAGPITRALFMTTPLRLTALDRSSGITRKPTNACRAGESTICTTPSATLIATIAATDAFPATARPTARRPAHRRPSGCR